MERRKWCALPVPIRKQFDAVVNAPAGNLHSASSSFCLVLSLQSIASLPEITLPLCTNDNIIPQNTLQLQD